MSTRELTVTDNKGTSIILKLTETSLEISVGSGNASRRRWSSGSPLPFLGSKSSTMVTQVPLRNVVAVTSSDVVEVLYLARKSPKRSLSLFRVEGSLGERNDTLAKQWCETVMAAAYRGRTPPKKVKVLINPRGGRGQAGSIYTNKVEPILRAAGCVLDVTYTTHPKHALEIAQELSLDIDALVVVSGDGLIHEVLNGFSKHTQPDKAFCIPIAPIPAGSGNGLSLNLLGLQDGLDPRAAALNVLKGLHLKVDLFAFTQGNQRRLSFMSQTVGLTAHIDIETEHLRWMGDLRFVIGFLRSVVTLPTCQMELSIKLAEQDKVKMANAVRARRADAPSDIPTMPTSSSSENIYDPGSPGDTWIKYDKPCLWVYAGKGPYVSRSLMQFPVSQPDDGLIDMAIQEIIPRKDLLAAMEGADKGRCYWFGTNRYFKASAYSAKPHAKSRGALVVDGELFPMQEFHVEVLPRLGTLLSPFPYYAPEFTLGENGKPGS
ncbi:ATP-NAD kinase-like domain-containing protein [Pisolithus croceorrhizus]|nr:ATP-NAD kinase-like domain-containing protein [Pisolithus croceorrhizus]KAI6132224.1 ATP-NAD kinase-like domain-containing protein [Pisolithus croceorrhizus]KAI6160067.1 ATP-NAD kinase-like domain-containing protein [Pisolithus thermaeus]